MGAIPIVRPWASDRFVFGGTLQAMSGRMPVRTCVGCRQRDRQSDLLRVVLRGSVAIPDIRGRQSGRGAYLHRDEVCLAQAERRRSLARALRTRRTVSLEYVYDALQSSGEYSNQEFGSQSGDEMSTQ